jgi:ketosteroid isomerase-like protein
LRPQLPAAIISDVREEAAIREIVDRETRAWDTKDVPLLLTVFHPDMVWAWPATYTAHDPVDWHLSLGRFDAARWAALYEDLFRKRTLIHNRRETVRIEVSAQGDGALAVVDIDTLWREDATGAIDQWLGRTCKLYALVQGEWKMTAQTGALQY